MRRGDPEGAALRPLPLKLLARSREVLLEPHEPRSMFYDSNGQIHDFPFLEGALGSRWLDAQISYKVQFLLQRAAAGVFLVSTLFATAFVALSVHRSVETVVSRSLVAILFAIAYLYSRRYRTTNNVVLLFLLAQSVLWAWPLLSEGAEELTIGVISTHTIFYSILFLIAAIFIDLGRISLLAIEQMIILLVVAGKDNSSFSASVEAVLYVTFLAALTGAAVLLRNRIISILSSGSAEAMRLKSQFVSNMSHELRTPLTAITGALELLARSHLAPAQIGHHAVASDATTQMLALVNNYLDYSKFEAGVVELASEGFSLRSTVRSAVQAIADEAAIKGLELAFEIADECPDQLLGDQERIMQLMINFLTNALKFTVSGFVFLRVSIGALPGMESRASAMVLLTPGSVCLRFEVEDSGPGIEDVVLPSLFSGFAAVDTSPSREFQQGAGLGLVISKRIAKAMGGSVGVRSRLGKGSTFWFTAVFIVSDSRRAGHIEAVALHPPPAHPRAQPVGLTAQQPPAPPALRRKLGDVFLLHTNRLFAEKLQASLSGVAQRVVGMLSLSSILALRPSLDALIVDESVIPLHKFANEYLRQLRGLNCLAFFLTAERHATEQLRRLRGLGIIVIIKPVQLYSLRMALSVEPRAAFALAGRSEDSPEKDSPLLSTGAEPKPSQQAQAPESEALGEHALASKRVEVPKPQQPSPPLASVQQQRHVPLQSEQAEPYPAQHAQAPEAPVPPPPVRAKQEEPAVLPEVQPQQQVAQQQQPPPMQGEEAAATAESTGRAATSLRKVAPVFTKAAEAMGISVEELLGLNGVPKEITAEFAPRERRQLNNYFTMKAMREAEEAEAARQATEPRGPELNILLVEDNGFTQMVTTALLGELGHRVESAMNGEEAVRVFRSNLEKVAKREAAPFDAILMDFFMPVKDGCSATREIRAWESRLSCPVRLPPVPILAYTASTARSDLEQCRAAGMDDHLLKPVRLDALRRIMEELAPRIEARRAAAAERSVGAAGPPQAQGVPASVQEQAQPRAPTREDSLMSLPGMVEADEAPLLEEEKKR